MADKYIYEVYKDGEYIGDYQMEELKKEFHMSGVNIRNAVAEGRTIRRKYRIIKADIVLPKASPLYIEFGVLARWILEEARKYEQTAKKKTYKKLTGNNPQKFLSYSGLAYNAAIQKPWGGLQEYLRRIENIENKRKVKRQQETIENLEGFNRAMTERRTSCRKRNWKKC